MTDNTTHPVTEQAGELLKGYTAGRDAAKAVQPGDRFTGAVPAMAEAGIERGSPRARGFMTGYLEVISRRFPTGVVVDAAGRLIEPGRADPDAVLTTFWNTGAMYGAEGQPITARLYRDGTIVFMDFARGIGGRIERTRALGMMTEAAVREVTMRAYLSNRYAHDARAEYLPRGI